MREFQDTDGRAWTASYREEKGPDYKGRFYMVIEPADDSAAEPLVLREVRWNSARTARRTLETMSPFELRRRLRSALARRPLARAS